jgi:hypothetical protein
MIYFRVQQTLTFCELLYTITIQVFLFMAVYVRVESPLPGPCLDRGVTDT